MIKKGFLAGIGILLAGALGAVNADACYVNVGGITLKNIVVGVGVVRKFHEFPQIMKGIGEELYYRDMNLIRVTIPDRIKNIAVGAFQGSSLSKVIFSDSSVIKIEDLAFQGCANLKGTLYLPSSLEDIGRESFMGTRYNHIHFPNEPSLRVIGSQAFQGSALAGTLRIPDSVQRIDDEAFARTAITKVSLPRDTVISRTAFPEGCRIIRRWR